MLAYSPKPHSFEAGIQFQLFLTLESELLVSVLFLLPSMLYIGTQLYRSGSWWQIDCTLKWGN